MSMRSLIEIGIAVQRTAIDASPPLVVGDARGRAGAVGVDEDERVGACAVFGDGGKARVDEVGGGWHLWSLGRESDSKMVQRVRRRNPPAAARLSRATSHPCSRDHKLDVAPHALDIADQRLEREAVEFPAA